MDEGKGGKGAKVWLRLLCERGADLSEGKFSGFCNLAETGIGSGHDGVDGIGAFDAHEFLVQSAVEEGEVVGIYSQQV